MTAARWELVCRVIDNYGDAGIALRLARQLALEYPCEVTLWIDSLPTLQRLCPEVNPSAGEQRLDCGVTVCWLKADTPVPKRPGSGYWCEVIVDLFGAGLPDAWSSDLAAQFPYGSKPKCAPPTWWVFEYLSAEDFVDAMHGKPSPPPNADVPRYFFFPGYTETSGGILRETNVLSDRDNFLACTEVRTNIPDNNLLISLFCYDTPLVTQLMTALGALSQPLTVLVPEGVAVNALAGWRESTALDVRTIPFTDQSGYDRLLWTCDLNFVRGEDSLTRALWAARPFVWQAYRQPENAHHAKVNAFLRRYQTPPNPLIDGDLTALMQWWNGQTPDFPTTALAGLLHNLDAWRGVAQERTAALATQSDLATRLWRAQTKK